MRGFASFFRKESVEILRTWRIWVLPGIVLFFALSGPFMARFTPQIIKAVTSGQSGMVIEVPDPTYLDSYAQWIKNLSQIVLFAVVIIYGGLVSSERKSGTAVLVLTKPVSRTAFVLAKSTVHMLLLGLTVSLGTMLTWALTAAIFGDAPPGGLLLASGAWLAFGLLFIGVMTLLSVALRSQAGAAGLGLAIYALVSIASIWRPAGEFTPAGLVGAPAAIAMGKAVPVLWPAVTSLLAAAAFVAAAAMLFRRQEL